MPAPRPEQRRKSKPAVSAAGEVTFVLDSLLERARRLDAPQRAEIELEPSEVAEQIEPPHGGAGGGWP
jgi:hypothetical protein